MVARNKGGNAFRSGLAFTSLVAELLRRLGKQDVRQEPDDIIGFEPDIIFGGSDALTVVELKFYRRTSPPGSTLFIRALEFTQEARSRIGADKGILVISCPLWPKFADIIGNFPDVDVWDEKTLFDLAAPFPDIRDQLEALLEVDSAKEPVIDRLVCPAVASPGMRDNNFEAPPKKGRQLADELLAIERGRPMAFDFESATINALKYLFEHDLYGWHEQSRTVDGLHRRDLVCRILSKSAEVWRLMLDGLGSRYVVFEFKNYTKPITQNEVITTERYLYPAALRKVAVVISHEECAESATSVIAGAMREHGKLIIPIAVPEIVNLLIAKDEGTDPNSYLFDRVDQFLMGLGR